LNKIIFPLSAAMQGEAVADLQDGLQLLLEHAGIQLSAAELQAFQERLRRERAVSTYKDATAKLVALFQQQHQISSSGAVDEATAKALNAVLEELGAFSPAARIFGMVRNEHGEPLDGVTVQAVDRDLRSEQLLGFTRTRAGRYEIRYQRSLSRKSEKDSADLVLKILDAEGNQLYKTPIHYNIPDELELDIALQGVRYQGPAEWERLTETLIPLLEGISPLELREDDQFQDISFLVGETGTSSVTIGIWATSFHLADKSAREETPLPPEVFFGFMRQGQPAIFYTTLLQNMHLPDRMALLEDKILRGIAEIAPDLQQALLEKAIADTLIPARIQPSIKEILETLRRIKLRYAAESVFGGGKGTISQLLELTPAAKQAQAAFMAALTAHSGSIATFWKKLEENQVLPPATVQQVKLSFDLGALTRNHIPLVGELVKQFASGGLKAKRELAKLDRAAWKRVFMRPGADGQPIGVPSNIDGETPEAKMEQYAAILEQQFERAYPTTSFAAKLERTEQSPVQAKSAIVRFLDNNPGFQLDRFRVEHYIAEHPEALQGIEDKAALLTNLKSVQRVFKLNPTHQAVSALLTHKIDSAQQIYFMGQGQFMTAMAESGINTIEARKLYRKAENTYALALAMFGDHNMAINGVTPFGVATRILDADTQAKIAALPNLQTLFGSLDYCECTHCRSVYSPAAYFVDVMRFLGERGTQGSTLNAGKNVQQVVLERRPDLGEIELSCENTNTPLPYIDLVNEILEDVVAPPAPLTLSSAIEADLVAGPIKPSVLTRLTNRGVAIDADAQVYAPDIRSQWAIRDTQRAYKVFKTGGTLSLLPTRQTFLSAAELRANPEHTNLDAYAKLKQEVFPLNLPFDLWHVQARAYLGHLGVPQPRLLELFQQRLADDVTLAPSELQIDCAWLGITTTERRILTGALPGQQPWDFWGLVETGNDIPNPENPADPTDRITGTWIDVLGNVNVMLHRSGLTYQELLQLLDMQYVNPNGGIFIDDSADSNAANCDTSKFMIRNLRQGVLNRMQRFIRLWRKLGYAMWELDLLLPDTNPAANVIDKRITDAVLQDISRMQRLRAQTGLNVRIVYSLYNSIDHNIYVDRSQEGTPSVQTLYQRLFRNKLVDAVVSFPASPDQITGTIADHVPGILAAFRIKEADLDLILADLGLTVTATLDVTALSAIYRITVLAQVLRLRVDPFLRLKRLWAQDPFADPAATHRFVELAQHVAASNFSVLELDYLLAHRFTARSGVALEDKTIITIIQAIRAGLQEISDDLRLKTEETNHAYVKSKLGLLPALGKDADQVIALSIIDGTWQGLPADRNVLIDTFFTGVLDPAIARVNLAAIPGGLSPAAQQDEVDKRFNYVQPALEGFLLQTQQETFIRQKVAEVLQLDVPSASVLLSGLRLPSVTGTLLQSINETRLLNKLLDGSYQFALDETNFPAIFTSLRLLHKNALMVGKLHIQVDELTWWLDGGHASAMGWMHPMDFPIDTTAQVDITQWVAIQQFFVWKGGLPKSDLTALEFATNVLDNATSSTANINDLAQLTAWEPADINALAAAFHWVDAAANFDVIKQQLTQSASLVRLADCMAALRRLGVNAARAIEWANAEPDSADAESLKQTVKAKYDLTQWQQVIQPLQDEFREQKRYALVSWLIAHPNQSAGQSWVDSNGLYSYFLIDVEMSACMLTSRLKQAAASAQLFVQRCLMNLEVDILAQTDVDPKWRQWKWMKQYRVWEANRKVFLYPENWIEPELRDEKSPFFKDLEAELMQNDITNDTAETAYLNYLEKLDKVANLEIRATHKQIISQDESVLHVFGRTRSSLGAEHYYRKRINGGRWTAWEKVELDITANHLVASVHNRRLYLLWPQFLDKADEPKTIRTPTANANITIEHPRKYWEIRLFWSEYKQGKWTPKVLSDSFQTVYQEDNTGGNFPERISFRVRSKPQIFVRLFATNNPAGSIPIGSDGYQKIGRQISSDGDGITEVLFAPTNGIFQNGLIKNAGVPYHFYFNSLDDSVQEDIFTGLPAPQDQANSVKVLDKPLKPNFTVIDSYAQSAEGNGSVFLWDTNRTYMIDYAWHKESQSAASTPSGPSRPQLTSSFRFYIHYHPFVELFIKELNIWGLKGLLNRRIQIAPASVPGSPPLFDFSTYGPTDKVIKHDQLPDKTYTYPVEEVDFSYQGAYAPYNWELFFHVPFFIANKLSANQRFEEALAWYHTIFDPTNPDTTVADLGTPQQQFWITKPFYETTKADYYKQKIENIMLAIAKGDTELREQVKEWRDHPFNPHLIARMRTVAYQKNVLIKYIQTLIAWGDQLFSRDTIETINEATQLYILAASILGPRPKSIPKKIANPIMTLYQLQQAGIDDFGNVLKEIENLLPAVSSAGTLGADGPDLPHLDVLYFCIPNNEKLLTLWDTVADRLFKIRHCMNIEGEVRQLPLFEPPIDPALLVKAIAGGLDIGAVLNDMNAPLPLYRFTFMIQRSLEICNEVKALGSAMLVALEKRDAEAFTLLRSRHELVMLDQVRMVRGMQVDEALRTLEGLQVSKKVIQERQNYYQKLINDGWSRGETLSLSMSGGAIVAETVATGLDATIAAVGLFADLNAGASGFGGSPHATITLGGRQFAISLSGAAAVSKGIASILQTSAAMTSTISSYERRAEEWAFQKRLAETELPQIEKQIVAADIRLQIAQQEMANHDRQIENAQSEDEYMRTKFTNQELYDWMIGQLSTVYFQSYQLAYDIAKRAERCFRYELGLSDSSYIQFGYWDSLKKGLLSGERLHYDLKRLETAYYEQNRREYELTKHLSLAQLDPIALLKLRQNGECFVDIPETAYDMDYPGHYFRRIKTVSLSIPCIVGPYTTVACTLTLTSNQVRKDANLLANKYARDLTNDDPRFRDEIAAIQSIATSSAQNDDGMFELNFRDERYLPFEAAGAISTWHIKLNKDFPQFGFSTISDVIIHLNYTAREGGELLRSKVVDELNTQLNELALAENRRGLYRIFDLKREYSDKWYKFLQPANPADDQSLVLDDLPDRLPYFTQAFTTKQGRQIEVVAQVKDGDGATYNVMLSPLGETSADLLSLAPDPTYHGLHRALKDLTGSEINFGTWTLKLQLAGAADFKSLPADAIQELFLIINYTIA
jgi:hypothetical protein